MEPELQNNSAHSKSNKLTLVFAVVIILGVFYFWSQMGSLTQPPLISSNNESDEITTFNFLPLTLEEKAALNSPKSATAQQAISAHAEAVYKIATVANLVAVGVDCRVSPVVLKIQKDKMINFRNYDNIDHTMIFGENRSVVVPANGSASLPANFGEVLRIYGYGCELGSEPIGMILIAE